MQLSGFPQCSLFKPEFGEGETLRVQYMKPAEATVEDHPLQNEVLSMPLDSDVTQLERADLNIHNSMVLAYRMGKKYDEWFTACFGFPVAFCYIGDEKRPILGTFSPKSPKHQPQGWFSSVSNYVMGSGTEESEADWITFSDCAPLMIASEASLGNVRARLSSGEVEMYKFRPNIVVDGEEEWAEDYWGELSLNGKPMFTLTAMCGRCTSLNVDYETGQPGKGESGQVLKKLMSDRRVDKGSKWSPVFGTYGFLTGDATNIAVGDDVEVTKRKTERSVWDWPMGKDKELQKYYTR